MRARAPSGRCEGFAQQSNKRNWQVKDKPDVLLVLLAVFGLGVLLTLMLPMAARDTVAAPASELHAGILLDEDK